LILATNAALMTAAIGEGGVEDEEMNLSENETTAAAPPPSPVGGANLHIVDPEDLAAMALSEEEEEEGEGGDDDDVEALEIASIELASPPPWRSVKVKLVIGARGTTTPVIGNSPPRAGSKHQMTPQSVQRSMRSRMAEAGDEDNMDYDDHVLGSPDLDLAAEALDLLSALGAGDPGNGGQGLNVVVSPDAGPMLGPALMVLAAPVVAAPPLGDGAPVALVVNEEDNDAEGFDEDENIAVIGDAAAIGTRLSTLVVSFEKSCPLTFLPTQVNNVNVPTLFTLPDQPLPSAKFPRAFVVTVETESAATVTGAGAEEAMIEHDASTTPGVFGPRFTSLIISSGAKAPVVEVSSAGTFFIGALLPVVEHSVRTSGGNKISINTDSSTWAYLVVSVDPPMPGGNPIMLVPHNPANEACRRWRDQSTLDKYSRNPKRFRSTYHSGMHPIDHAMLVNVEDKLFVWLPGRPTPNANDTSSELFALARLQTQLPAPQQRPVVDLKDTIEQQDKPHGAARLSAMLVFNRLAAHAWALTAAKNVADEVVIYLLFLLMLGLYHCNHQQLHALPNEFFPVTRNERARGVLDDPSMTREAKKMAIMAIATDPRGDVIPMITNLLHMLPPPPPLPPGAIVGPGATLLAQNPLAEAVEELPPLVPSMPALPVMPNVAMMNIFSDEDFHALEEVLGVRVVDTGDDEGRVRMKTFDDV
jgi:hypothetical protein